MAVLQSAERMAQRDAAFCRRWYRRTGMTRRQVAYHGDRRCWPDACQMVRLNGAGPYTAHGGRAFGLGRLAETVA